MKQLCLALVIFGSLFVSCMVLAEDDVDLYEMSLDDLLNMEVETASITAKPIREQPAIVAVISGAEIKETGARDLEDVLLLVPGFASGLDVTGVTGMGLRGFWAYLGQIVVIVDGMEITDSLFGVFPTGSHIPAEQIERVEVIRGPGSAKYGGNAEVAVILVTTINADLEGFAANTTLGTSGGVFSHRYGLNGGRGFTDGHAHFSASLGRDYRSDRDFTGYDGTVFDMSEESDMETLLISAGADYKDASITLLYDAYNLKDRTYYGEPTAETYDMNFDTFVGTLSYDYSPNESITVTPSISYNKQNPWAMLNGALEGAEYTIETSRMTYNLSAISKLSDNASVLVGTEYFDEEATATDTDDGTNLHFADYTTDTASYTSTAVFAQYELSTSFANFTAGGRYQDHSYAGDSFVPRFGVTRAWDSFHVKALYGESFRIPQIELINYAAGGPIKPEMATAYEFEAGYRLSETVSLVGNIFYVSVNDILVFDTFEGVDTYANWEEVANYGFEGEVRVRDDWGSAAVGYSFYRPDNNTVDLYATGDDNLLVGFAAHKVTFNVTRNVTSNIQANLSGAYSSKRLAYSADTVGESVVEFDPEFLADLLVNYKFDRYDVGIGVKDLFDVGTVYLQPANSWMPPVPGKSREFFARVALSI